jgi:hypothetical protein
MFLSEEWVFIPEFFMSQHFLPQSGGQKRSAPTSTGTLHFALLAADYAAR